MTHPKESEWPGVEVNGRMIRTPEEYNALTSEEAMKVLIVLEERGRLGLELTIEEGRNQGMEEEELVRIKDTMKKEYGDLTTLRIMTEGLLSSKLHDQDIFRKLQIEGRQMGIEYLNKQLSEISPSPEIQAYIFRRIAVLNTNIHMLQQGQQSSQ